MKLSNHRENGLDWGCDGCGVVYPCKPGFSFYTCLKCDKDWCPNCFHLAGIPIPKKTEDGLNFIHFNACTSLQLFLLAWFPFLKSCFSNGKKKRKIIDQTLKKMNDKLDITEIILNMRTLSQLKLQADLKTEEKEKINLSSDSDSNFPSIDIHAPKLEPNQVLTDATQVNLVEPIEKQDGADQHEVAIKGHLKQISS
jgi:hypothetical protein